jgi:hypothetical protein
LIEHEEVRNRAAMQDELVKTQGNIPTTLKRRRLHKADQKSPSNSGSATRPWKSRRINSSAQENRNKESQGVNDIVTPHTELIQLIEESAIGFGKIAANLENIANSLKNHPGW